MISNNTYYELFASYTVPDHNRVGYWVDLGANSKGKVIKTYNENLKKWVKVTDATSEDAVAPFIGNNGNWWIDNRDTGIFASGRPPFIGNNDNWFTYDSSGNPVDTGKSSKGAPGLQGPAGVKGDKGETGPVGKDATINGYSNVEIVAGNNITVTQEENKLTINADVQDVELDNYLSKDNTEVYNPTTDYNPATKKYVDDTVASVDVTDQISGKADTTYVNKQLDTKVDKVTGKQLSTNDYTTTDKNKLAGIEEGAEVNVNADWNATSGDAQILNKPTIITEAEVDQKISTAVGAVYKVKGSVANYAALPTENVSIGDVYNLEDTGANYVAISTTPDWDKLSETVDLSGYLTKTEATSTYQPKGNYLTSVPEEYVTETELTAKGYATTTQVNTKLDSSAYTATDVLSKVKTVDGSDSGLDADLLDGKHGSEYALKTDIVEEAPKDGKQYVRKDGEWANLSIEPSSPFVNQEYADIVVNAINNNSISSDDYNKLSAWAVPVDNFYPYAETLFQGAVARMSIFTEDDGIYAYMHMTQTLTNSPLYTGFALVEIKEDLTLTIKEESGIALKSSGDGTRFLANDGTYKEIDTSNLATKNELEGKQNTISDLETIRSNAEKGKQALKSLPTNLSQLASDKTHRTVTDSEKSTWNSKSDFSGSFSDLTNIPAKITNLRSYTTATTVASLNVNYENIYVTLTANASLSASATGANYNGRTITAYVYTAAARTITIPTTGNYVSMCGSSFTTTASGWVEFNLTCINGIWHIAKLEQE